MKATEAIDKIIGKLEEAKGDAERHDKEQRAAGTRLRKTLQGLKGELDDVRKGVLADQKSW